MTLTLFSGQFQFLTYDIIDEGMHILEIFSGHLKLDIKVE